MEKSKIYLFLIFVFTTVAGISQQTELSIQTGHNASIKKLCYSPNGKILASADLQNKIILWDMETGGQMVKFYIGSEKTENAISTLTFNKEGNYLFAGTKSGTVYVFDVAASREVTCRKFFSSINSLVFSENNNCIYVLTDSLFIYNFIDFSSKKISNQSFIHISRSYKNECYLINNNGEVYTMSSGDSLKKHGYSFYDQEVLAKKRLHRELVYAKVDKKLADAKREKQVLRLKSRKNMVDSYFLRTGITRAVFSTDAENVYSSLSDYRIQATSIKESQTLFTRASTYIDELFTSIALCEKYNFLFASNADGKIYVIDAETGKLVTFLRNHLSDVNDVAVSPDQNYLASASTDRSIIIWNCNTLEPVRRLYSRAFSITSMDISKDGKKLVFADEIGFAKTIDLSSVMLDMKSVEAHRQAVPLISFTRNDTTFISAGNDNKINIIDFNSSGILARTTFQHYFQLNMIVLDLLEILGIYIPPKSQMDSLVFNGPGNSFDLIGGRFRKGKFTFARYRNTFDLNTLSKIRTEKTGHEKKIEYYSYNHLLNLNDTVKYGIDFCNKVTGHTDKISGIKEIPGKQMVVTSSLDATLKIWDTKNKKLLMTLIPVDKNKLIKLTSDNYYMAPKNALTAIGFKYGMSFFPPEQFDVRYNRPDKVMAEFGTATPMLLKAYEIAYNKRLKKLNMTQEMLGKDFHAPEVSVSEISCQLNTSDNSVKFKVSASDSKYNLNRINVYNNDIPVYGTKGIETGDKNSGTYSGLIEVNLIPGKNKIQVSGFNEKGAESLKNTFDIYRTPTNEKPDLYIITIGVSKYNDSRFNLNYAAKDARDVSSLFSQLKNDNYGNIFNKTYTDSEVTKENIINLKKFLQQSRSNDVVIVFIAGHGMLDEQFNYYFGTYDLDFNNPSLRGIEYSEIENLLDGIPAMKKILFMDTCHSGEADKDELELTSQTIVESGNIKFRNAGVGVRNKKAFGMYNTNEMMKEVFADIRKGTGSTVVSSAGATEFAFEGKSWSNGLFTYCLLKGLRDRAADLNNDKIIVLSELQDYIRKNVTELSGGLQVPNSRVENISMDFRVW